MAKLKQYGNNLDTNQDAATGGDFYTGDVPPAGVYKGVVKRVTIKQNKNGDDMLNVLTEIKEPKGSPKAKFNGYGIWNNINITDQGVPYVKAFLLAVGANPDDFFAGKGNVDDKVTPNRLLSVGRFKFTEDGVPVVCATKRTTFQGNDRLEVRQYLAADEPEDDEDDDIEVIEEDDDMEDVEESEEEYEDDEDADEDEDEDESDEDESEDEDEDADEDEEEEDGYTREELDDLSIIELKAILKENGWTPADYKGYSKDDLVNAILGEDEDEDDEADDAEDDDEPPF